MVSFRKEITHKVDSIIMGMNELKNETIESNSKILELLTKNDQKIKNKNNLIYSLNNQFRNYNE